MTYIPVSFFVFSVFFQRFSFLALLFTPHYGWVGWQVGVGGGLVLVCVEWIKLINCFLELIKCELINFTKEGHNNSASLPSDKLNVQRTSYYFYLKHPGCTRYIFIYA